MFLKVEVGFVQFFTQAQLAINFVDHNGKRLRVLYHLFFLLVNLMTFIFYLGLSFGYSIEKPLLLLMFFRIR